MKPIITIYVLKDPESGAVRYVGRTVNPLRRRLREHIRTARTGKLKDKRKEQWLLGLLERNLYPVIEAIEVCGPATYQQAEKRWVAHYRERCPDLLNVKAGGDGGMGGHFLHWTPELDALLGTVADSTLARQLNCTRKSVTYRRDKLGIPASYDRTNNVPPPRMGGHNRKTLDDATLAMLGTMPDEVLAQQAGVSKKRIMTERHKRGIPSYARQTGNTGQFGPRLKPRKIELDDERLAILGTMPDRDAAAILGMSHTRLCAIRKLKGIPSYRSKRADTCTSTCTKSKE